MHYQASSVHLPASLVADFSDLREKTMKIGQVGRSLAIFRVEKVYIYDDDEKRVENADEEVNIIKTLLEYLETPQYLRKDLFPYMEELKYAGILPPLRTAHHPLKDERNEVGDFREACVRKVESGESLLNIGLSEVGIVEDELKEGTRLTVRLGEKISEDRRIVHLVEGEIEEYWGYEVSKNSSLAQSLSKSSAEVVLGTSRYGQDLYEGIEGIKPNNGDKITVAFGGPYQGLYEICGTQGENPDRLFDAVVNTIPRQGTETVRSEEALIATLAILNTL